ncbi:uncharacterized protein LOC129605937 [Condylostylus longicornis]|uniref:uncharacterized protein LOC129605937 n=1 Tax=Condylostylus longicornis TaxID=2530218 RepID=UPI00244DC43D|nr:uncharacterized protein LOC129605937 [Condylostylus longicornis]XP_055371944.1 uncharacterized protein LOC129605937 [Condylostylus longicornis]
MATRRPRIKPVANISSIKRKVKRSLDSNTSENLIKESEEKYDIEMSIKKDCLFIKHEGITSDNQFSIPLEPDSVQIEGASLQKNRNNTGKIADNTNAGENIQKPRQRIRATPCFDIRRNSVTNSTSAVLLPQSSNSVSNNNVFFNQDADKSPKKDNMLSKQCNTSGNRTPNNTRVHRYSESSGGGFLSPISVQYNPPNFLPNQNQLNQHLPSDGNSNIIPSREHIQQPPQRYRKISSMEETQKLSSARREFQTKYSRKSPEKSELTLCDFIFYNPSSNPMVFETKHENLNENVIESENVIQKVENKEVENEDKEEGERAPVPQLKLGPNGEIILDEKSLVIETTAEKQAKSALAASKSAIYLDEYSGNNGFYSRQKRTKDWTPEETIKFYRCLHTIGTDFSMMLSLFPNRSRRDLKLKFKKEERNNVVLINKALLHPNTFDIDSLKNELQKEEDIAKEKRKAETNRVLKLQKKLESKCLNSEADDKASKGSSLYSRTKNALSRGNLVYELEGTNMISNVTRKKSGCNIKKDAENINYEQIESTIKDENYVLPEKIDQFVESNDTISNDNYQTISFQQQTISNDNISTTETDLDDIASVYSTNEFGYDELTGIEITDIGDILTLEDTLPEFKNSTLAIVSKHDKTSPEKITHGIYIICRSTGIMSQKPLDLPEETVNCILKAMGKI